MSSLTIAGAHKRKAVWGATRTALQNPQLQYAPITALVQANEAGSRQAAAVLADIHSGFAGEDALYLALKRIVGGDIPTKSLAELRAFAHRVQLVAGGQQ